MPLQQELGADWKTVEEHHLEKLFKFDTYREGIDFVNAVAEIAEEQQHHPDILLTYGKVKITIWTHAINGLTESGVGAIVKKIESESIQSPPDPRPIPDHAPSDPVDRRSAGSRFRPISSAYFGCDSLNPSPDG